MLRLAILLLVFFGFSDQSVAVAASNAAKVQQSLKLTFVSNSEENEAFKYRQLLVNKYGVSGKFSAFELAKKGFAALKKNNSRLASDYFSRAAGLKPKKPMYWAGLYLAISQVQPKNNRERRHFSNIALAATLVAYQTSIAIADKAQALALMAKSYQTRRRFRSALEAFKASLLLVSSVAVRHDYQTLRAEHGFRMLRYTVDAEAVSPRICLQFSEDLLTSVQYEPYLTVDGKMPTTLVRESRQLCIDRLQHGKKYHLGIRTGLPSTVNEVIEKPVALDIYIRDRKPALRFSGSHYLLPRVGSKGIPLVSVNTSTARLQLYRIGERGLSVLLADKRFLKSLDHYSLQDLKSRLAIKVWQGDLMIVNRPNREVTTRFPVDKALPKREPGVYVLIAEPEGIVTRDWQDRATQWFVVSDIGLTTLRGNDGLHVFVRSLASALPLSGVKLQLLAHSNEVLATGVTDRDGYARFPPGLIRGEGPSAPGLILAHSRQGDLVLVDLSTPGFDLSDRGVRGRKAPGPMDLFLYTDRGIYRAGETVHLNALLRDRALRAVTGLPLTVRFERPDGKLAASHVIPAAGAGGHVFSWKLLSNAMQGNWQIKVFADVKQPPLAHKTILVEDFVPDQIEFDLTAGDNKLRRGGQVKIALAARYLYGAPAQGLQPEGEVQFTRVRQFADFPGYVFGLEGETPFSLRETFRDLMATNAQGNTHVQFSIGQLKGNNGPLRADVTVRLRESGGRAVERVLALPVAASTEQIGLKAGFAEGRVTEGAMASFGVITVNPDGKRTARKGLQWSLLRLERHYQWYRSGSGWQYEAVISSTKVASGAVDTSVDQTAHIVAKTDWGRYRLEIAGADRNGSATSTLFTAGWYVDATSTETPDGLEIALDENHYSPGAVAKLRITPRFSGQALVVVGSDQLLWSQALTLSRQGAVISIPVSPDWGTGAYVTIFAFKGSEGESARMPARAVGVQWLKIDPQQHRLHLDLAVQKKIRPGSTLQVPLKVSGIAPGDEAYVTVAAVDVGILNLTAFTPPSPENWYFGQRRLGLGITDLYGKLIDGFAGTVGRIRSGGDIASLRVRHTALHRQPVALFSGIVKVGKDGRVRVPFDVPEFTGSLRVMAVAWSGRAVGQASADVFVRDPVVMLANLPKFLAPGDRSRLLLAINNTAGATGDYWLQVTTVDDVMVGEEGQDQMLVLKAGQKRILSVPLQAVKPGLGKIEIALTQPSGEVLRKHLSIPVRSPQLPASMRSVRRLPAHGGTLKVDRHDIEGLEAESASMSVQVSRSSGLDVISLLQALDRYPYGCAEQTTSRALPLLYWPQLAMVAGLGDSNAIHKRVQDAIDKLGSYQSAGGSFGMWGPGSDNLWLDAYVTDFLGRAREAGFDVADELLKLALQNLQNSISYDDQLIRRGNEIAYALYVLARNKQASIGDLRYLVEARLKDIVSPLAKAQLAASLGFYGDNKRSLWAFDKAYQALQKAVKKQLSSDDYGSVLRDQAAVLALAAEASPEPEFVPKLVKQLNRSRIEKGRTSTQENAWLTLAARALQTGDDQIHLQVDGVSHEGRYRTRLDSARLASGLVVSNASSYSVDATLTTTGRSEQPLPAGGEGFTIDRQYYDLQGQQVSGKNVVQNTRLVVVLVIDDKQRLKSRIVVRDLLPAGLEIVSPHLFSSAGLKQFSWLKLSPVEHSEFRDDRFVAALNLQSGQRHQITLAYMVRAVSPGVYVQPAAVVEDMYRPYRSSRTVQGQVTVVQSAQ